MLRKYLLWVIICTIFYRRKYIAAEIKMADKIIEIGTAITTVLEC